ncbi:MAG TPA: DUF799 family lipoprotein [Syntrophales bacterium]|nr:DUF799 family lipoprotein [Syntrophales bacterium]HOX94308.1 DUF799 family lipoprotein [Syntrophales bacterium]HPI58386.1 DUF799 family lipoprotein [Syntrophales bacterium]HPN26060.1 DUF799 family lipoprotein [Syntrophales bacterium]HQM30397.1 DUF799 family lipoprotein [Syntrophales bacterium]
MGMKTRVLVSVLIIAIGLAGCSWWGTQKPRPQFPEGREVRLIAVMPVLNETQSQDAPRMLRQKVFEELYFKGYPKIPLNVIDGRLREAFPAQAENLRARTPSSEVGRLLGAEAVLYLTLHEARTSPSYGVSVVVTVSASFELKNTRTGEILWQTTQRTAMREYDVTSKGKEQKVYLVYEDTIGEVVKKALDSLPDGPDFLG